MADASLSSTTSYGGLEELILASDPGARYTGFKPSQDSSPKTSRDRRGFEQRVDKMLDVKQRIAGAEHMAKSGRALAQYAPNPGSHLQHCINWACWCMPEILELRKWSWGDQLKAILCLILGLRLTWAT